MTDAERIARVQSFFDAGTLSDAEAEAYLAIAQDTLLNTLYPFSSHYPEDATVPTRYEGIWCELTYVAFFIDVLVYVAFDIIVISCIARVAPHMLEGEHYVARLP